MTNSNSTVSAGLLTAFGVLVAGLVPAFTANFWYGVVDLVAMVALALVYHFFFNE